MNFAKTFYKTKNKVLKLDIFYKIGKFHFIYKFLNSFNFNFTIFYTTLVKLSFYY